MALIDRQSNSSVNGTSVFMNLSPEIWHLIFSQIDSHKDLYNICLTSRTWFAMAVPYLYRIVPLEMLPLHIALDGEADREPTEWANSLSSRLLDIKNEQLRNAVHELDFGQFGDDEDLSEMEKRLVALIDSLPNLRRVKIRGRMTQEGFQNLIEHSKHLSLYLLAEDGRRRIENDLPNVVALAAEVNPSDEREGPNQDILGIQKLLFTCPNITSFSLEVTGGYGGCVVRMPRFERVYSFRFSGDEIFPPLEELSLSGYDIDEDEWEHWQGKLQWSKLKSLTLGPRYTADFLDLASGYAESLRTLTVQVYTDADGKISCPPLKNFLLTFTSLESLTVKGYRLGLGPIGNHPGLKHLCLHLFEPTGGETLRPTLSIEQLKELDQRCAQLETLELDLYRDGEWPKIILETLATGFRNLRRLTLHLELGIKNAKGLRSRDPEPDVYIKPILNEDSAKEVGQQFFNWRSSSNLSVLVLKTGEPLRRYPQWEPPYSVFERRNGDTVEVYRPKSMGDVPEVATIPRHFMSYW